METKKQNGGFFKVMYTTRVMIKRGEMTILNLSVLFSIIALITAPWLVIGGLLVALILGYRLSVDNSGEGFETSFDEVMENSKQTVKKVFNSEDE